MLAIKKFLRCCLLGMSTLGLLCSFSVASSQRVQYQIPNIKNYSVEAGLSQVSVYDIAQDNNGYIWLATQSGIDKFDGYDFTHFGQHKDEGKGLSGSLVYSIELEPVSGDLWIGTMNGLDVLRSSTQIFENIELRNHQNELDKDVQIIVIDNKHNIFVGTSKALYLKRPDEQGFAIISMPNQANTIHDILSQHDNRLLVATSNGILSYNKEMNVWRDELLARVEATALEIDTKGHLWIGTAGQGVFRADIRGNRFANVINFSSKDGFSDSYVNDIEQMDDGSLWVATTNGASIFPDPNELKFTNISSHASLNKGSVSDVITTLFHSSNGLIMFGTSTEGFGVLDMNSTMFRKLNLEEGVLSYFVAKQADDTLWLSTKLGVFKVAADYTLEGPWKHQDVNQSVNKIRSIVFDEENQTLWVASRLGVGKIRSGSDIIEDAALKDTAIYSIQIGSSGNLWVGSQYQGLVVIDTKTDQVLKSYDIPMAVTILPISEQEVWAATTGGLYKINPQTHAVRKFVNEPTNPNSIVHDVVTWISKRDEESFYVGTLGHGLHLLEFPNGQDEAVFTRLFSAGEKLANSSIGAVVDDKKGNIWVSTEKYIIRINLASGHLDTFDENDGVNKSGYYIGAHAVKSDGTIVFVGDEGVTHFRPEDIEKPDVMPDLQFTRVAILNSTDSHGVEEKFGIINNMADSVTKVVLSPDDILLSIEFAALEYGSPQSIQYAYRLIGFDDRWQYLDSKNRTVTYTNLDAGSYIFEVKSTNRYGIWNDKPQRMPIVVTPPWWQTMWAMVIFGIVALLIVFFIFRWRTYALHKRSRMLYQSVQDKTIELQLANEQLTLLTTLDPLTQVYNRRGFTDAVSKEFSKYKRNDEVFSIILIDIDFFKRINDDYGHEAGDQVLIKFASVLRECTRDYDILARWGGEEFIVLLPNTQLKDAIKIANKYREVVRAQVFSLGSISVRVSLTAGVANIQDYASIDECIKRADNLLYEGKALGRNQVLPML